MPDKKLTDSDKIAKWQKEKLGDKNYNEIQEKVKHDNEIVKALEWYVSKFKTAGFVYMDADGTHLIGTQDVLDLINHLQAENERLNREIDLVAKNSISAKYPNCVFCSKGVILTKSLEDYDELIGDISAEGIKKFADNIEKAFLKTERQMPNSEDIKLTVQICRNAIQIALKELVVNK